MTLFDVDKNGFDRSSPRPNSHDVLFDLARKYYGTNSFNPSTSATSTNSLGATNSLLQGSALTFFGGGSLQLTTTSISATAGNFNYKLDSVQTAHGLSFTPTVFAVDQGSNSLLPRTEIVSSGGGANAQWYELSVSANSLFITFNVSTVVYGNITTPSNVYIISYYLTQLPSVFPSIPFYK